MTENYLNILAETIRNNWDQPALTDFYLTEDGTAQDTSRGNHYTYGEMYMEICRVAELLTSLGLKKGDHIAICGANSSHWVIAYLAIAKMQGVSVTVMHSIQPDQIAQMLNFSDAKALFVNNELWAELEGQSLPQVQRVIALDDWQILRGEKQIINHKSKIINGECGFDFVEPDSLAMICFTSGSSGKPKGVMLLYRSLTANVACISELFPLKDNKRIASFFPIAHMFGLGGDVLDPLCQGCEVYFVSEKSLENILRSIFLIRPFRMLLVPLLMKMLTADNSIQFLPIFGTFLEYCLLGGAVPSADEISILKKNNFPLSVGYGMTETASLISVATVDEYRINTSGKFIGTLKGKLSNNGEILVKGDNVMLGYYKDPEATAAKIDKDGWLHTGDKGHLDEDGYLYVEGRLEQDIIVLPNGENIRPDNIEALINALPEVSESIVVARDGKLVAIVVPDKKIINLKSEIINIGELRRNILRAINPQLPLFSQLYDVEITDQPLQRTEKQTIKRYLYK